MIRKEDISAKTGKGLDIIRHLYPDAGRVIDSGNMKEAFKMRNERTPSAHLKEYDLWWVVTDFGDDQRGHNPISLWMKEKNLGFNEACIDINTELCLGLGDIKADVNQPRFEKLLDASPDMKEGQWYYELNEKFTDRELETMGPKVTQADVDALHWYSVKWVGKCKDRKITKKYSTEQYPIFMRECTYMVNGEQRKFYKKYEPLCFDKQYRFMYIGVKPRDYINGLQELKGEHFQLNETKRAEWEGNPANEGKPFKELKLKHAIICSGERDALCAKSLGYSPLWLNSETAELEPAQYKEVMKLVETLYNIPDKDETGIRRGRELALKFPELRTIWLPERFERFRDARGRFRKDFRDWLEMQDTPGVAMKTLVSQALPAKFWEERTKKKGEETSFSINSGCLQYFLRMQGFYKLKDKEANKVEFVRIRSNRVERVTTDDINEFLINWARGDEKRSPFSDMPSDVQSIDVQNLIIDSPRTSPAAISKLSSVDLDFCNYTPTSQLFFFQDNTVRVTADDIEVYDRGSAIELRRYVWEENIIKHTFKLLPAMFHITRELTEDGKPIYDISIDNTPSKVFCYLINSSRLYWRRELEDQLEDKTPEEREDYISGHRFTIDSETLAPEEIVDQKRALINKIFTIGYMLHGFKDPSRAWAPMAMDWKIGDDGECNGRSGKSFLFSQVLSKLLKTVKLSGRNAKLLDNPHVFDQVTRHTSMLLVDDCMKGIRMETFYDNITGDMTVNPKNNQSYNIDFTESPKIVFTTNYVPNNFDASTEARLLYMVFSDYYHQATEESDYHGSRSIRDDFGKSLFGVDYTEQEWNADLNFLLQCEQFYLQMLPTGDKIQPPMANILKRKQRQDMSSNFEQWAESYFHPLCVDHLDTIIPVVEALEDFRKVSGLKDTTQNGFTRKLRAFAKYCPYIEEINPADLCSASFKPDRGKQNGRIMRRLRDPMGHSYGSAVDHFYMKTNKEVYIPLKRQCESQDSVLDDAGLLPADEADGDKPF